MLQTLSIKNIVLIDHIEIDFTDGLCVLTGETGAGKTILLEALGLALGNRYDSSLIRKDMISGTVSASFLIKKNEKLKIILSNNMIEFEDNLILRRAIFSDGKSKAFINDEPVTVGFLKEIGSHLAEVQNQHANYDLLTSYRQKELLDQFASLENLLTEVSKDYKIWKSAENEYRLASKQIKEINENKEFLTRSVIEIDSLKIEKNEEENLVSHRDFFRNIEKYTSKVSEILECFDGPNGLSSTMHKVERLTSKLSINLDQKSENILSKVSSFVEEGNEVQLFFSKLKEEVNSDPAKLNYTEDRLYALRDVSRKYKCKINELNNLSEKFKFQLEEIENLNLNSENLRKKVNQYFANFEKKINILSEERKKSSKNLEEKVSVELSPLRLNNSRFRVLVKDLDKNEWGSDGGNKIIFEASTNLGIEYSPLSSIASGGELSRFMLALQVGLIGGEDNRTLIFDEADSGVGGATADAVGERLSRLSNQHQVLVITHSPQVAVRGKNHIRIFKKTKSQSTFTCVESLDKKKRTEEVARMLAGSAITNEARAAAERLFNEAK